MAMVTNGLDSLLKDPSLAPGRIGLITNHSAVTRDLTPGIDALRSAGLNVVALFGAEHGVRGDVAAGDHVASGVDARSRLPVHSLYGETRKPTPDMLTGIETLIFDLQDVGVRFWTFMSTLSLCMEAAGEAGIPVVVLDRPNPVGGTVVEGPLVKPGYESFIGKHATPIRYGLTVGELARFYRDGVGIQCDLTIIPMQGWTRNTTWEETGQAWMTPSPNIPTVDTARVYPGMCLVEGTNLSEGRGTTKPFETFGAPFVDADAIAEALNAYELPGARWRPVHFIPTASKHQGVTCHGCQLHITDNAAFRPVTAGVQLLVTLKRVYPNDFAWLPAFKEGRQRFFDLLAGSDALRIAVDAGTPAAKIVASWQDEIASFEPTRQAAMIYS